MGRIRSREWQGASTSTGLTQEKRREKEKARETVLAKPSLLNTAIGTSQNRVLPKNQNKKATAATTINPHKVAIYLCVTSYQFLFLSLVSTRHISLLARD